MALVVVGRGQAVVFGEGEALRAHVWYGTVRCMRRRLLFAHAGLLLW